MTLRNVTFLYWRSRQICIHSFWNLFRASLGDDGISYFLVYTYYRDKNWIARLGFGFRIYMIGQFYALMLLHVNVENY